jgi:hypothetical protein
MPIGRTRHRTPDAVARGCLAHADGKVIIMDEDGDLAKARMTPNGLTVRAWVAIFETTA